MSRRAWLEGGSAVLAGLLLYGGTAGLERLLDLGPAGSAFLEELGKTGLLLGFGLAASGGTTDRKPLRRARARNLGHARGLSLGLAAIAIFAGVENLAYLLAFPEFGVLGRLLWSLPVHLVAALLEALGLLWLFRARGPGRAAGALAGLGLAAAWHLSANLLAASELVSTIFTGGVAVALPLFTVLLWQFLKHAYLGGFLHGAD